MTTKTLAYARTHTAAYVSDKIAGLMKRLVNAFGFDPRGVADAWVEWIDLAARTWMESGHLTAFKIQFHMPGETLIRGGFEFPIRYDGNGVYYAATPNEAQQCRGAQVILVGGGTFASRGLVSCGEAALAAANPSRVPIHRFYLKATVTTNSSKAVRRCRVWPDTQILALDNYCNQ